MVSVSLGLPDLDVMVRLQGIAFPGPHRWSRCRVTLTYMRSSSPIRSGGGGLYRMVRIRCKSGVRIKIPESGFKNPDPDAFAFSLVWFTDPDHVRIRNHLHFAVLMNFFTDPDPRVRIQVRVTPNSFKKILNMTFLKENSDPRLPLDGSVYVFYNFSFKKRCGTRFEDWDADPGPWSGSADCGSGTRIRT